MLRWAVHSSWARSSFQLLEGPTLLSSDLQAEAPGGCLEATHFAQALSFLLGAFRSCWLGALCFSPRCAGVGFPELILFGVMVVLLGRDGCACPSFLSVCASFRHTYSDRCPPSSFCLFSPVTPLYFSDPAVLGLPFSSREVLEHMGSASLGLQLPGLSYPVPNGILVPDQGRNLSPLHWKSGLSAAGPPGKPSSVTLEDVSELLNLLFEFCPLVLVCLFEKLLSDTSFTLSGVELAVSFIFG